MRNRGNISVAIAFVALIALASCEVGKSLSSRNVDYIYLHNDLVLHPGYRFHHFGDSASHLYVKLPKQELLFSQKDGGDFTANISFRYYVYHSLEQYHPVDSGTVVLRDIPDTGSNEFVGKLEIPLSMGTSGVVEVKMLDLNRSRSAINYIRFKKDYHSSAGFFLPMGPEGNIVFTDYVGRPGVYTVRHTSPITELHVQFYSRNFDIAAPPFALVNPKPFDFTPDSSYRISATQPGEFSIPIARKGFYLLSLTEGGRRGFTFFFFGAEFPHTKSVMALITPTRYITTDAEYDNFTKVTDNLKLKIDGFWLRIGGNPDRAKEIIRAYYSRVERANDLFTSYVEGWKTDRGMCYIIFGPPDVVNLHSNSEHWVYGEAGNYATLNLTFTKVANPFTDNDFRLNRSSAFKNPWYRSVDVWRNGRILNLNQ